MEEQNDKVTKEHIESLAQTSVDSIANGNRSNTYIQEVVNILSKTVTKGDNALEVAQTYATLAMVDQLVLLNRGISALAQIMSIQTQMSSRIVPANTMPSNLISK